MNDRYIFRGKRFVDPDYTLDVGAWTYGYYTKKVRCTKDGGIIKIDAIENISKIDGAAYAIHHEIDATTLSQCTGLKDKNGSLIFEADIVKCLSPAGYSSTGIVKYITEHARWEYWHAKQKEGFPIIRYNNNLEIIGNVYDNPELLKEVEQCHT